MSRRLGLLENCARHGTRSEVIPDGRRRQRARRSKLGGARLNCNHAFERCRAMPGEFRGAQFGGLRRCFALEFVAAIRLDCCTTRRLLRYALGPDQQRAVQPLGSQRLLNRAAAGTHRLNRLLLQHRHWPARHGLIGLHLQNLGGARRRHQRAHSRAADLCLDAGRLGRHRGVRPARAGVSVAEGAARG